MASVNSVQRVRIYLGMEDMWEGGLRYLAILEQLRRGGATGATVLAGLVGFGPGQAVNAAGREPAEPQKPVVIEWLDRAERVGRLLPTLDELIGEALVTVETTPVYRATMRARGPFTADRSVGDVMRKPAPAVSAETLLPKALALLLNEGLGVLPVVNAQGTLVGLITRQDLVWRADLRLAPELLAALTSEEGAALLAPLATRSVQEVMRLEPASLGVNTSIPQALVTLVEWGYLHLPVVNRERRLVGLFGQEHALAEAVGQAADSSTQDSSVRDVEPPAPVRLVMQPATHQVALGTKLNLALAQLLAAPERRLWVVGERGQLIGVLSAISVLRGLPSNERAAWLTALQRPEPTPAAALPGAERSIDNLLEADPPSIGPQDNLLDAAQRLLELGVERLAVVDEQDELVGIIARGGLIRALLQQSE